MHANIATLNKLLTNDADASASVEYRPTMMLSANPTNIIPTCPINIGSPKVIIAR
jgi:hypothetical protein